MSDSEFSPEAQLLVRCARTSHDEVSRRRLRDLVSRDLDWDAFLELSATHQVMPLIANSMALAEDLAPPWVLDLFDELYRIHTLKTLRLTGVLAEVMEALGAAGIVAYPYKGPALAAAAYGNVLFRTFADLDVLVPKEDYLRAVEVVEGIGFVPTNEVVDDRFYLLWKSAHSFIRDGVYLDLQWGSTAIEGVSVPIGDEFWRTRTTIQVAGKIFPAIRAEDLILFLCGHGSRHFWDRLKWVCDVAELARASESLEWEHLFRRADGIGAGRVLRMGLILANSILEAPLSDEVLDASRTDRVAVRLAAEASRRLFAEQSSSNAAIIRFHLLMKTRWRDRLQYLRYRLMQPTPGDLAELRLSRRLTALYPFLVPLWRARRFVMSRFRAISDRRQAEGSDHALQEGISHGSRLGDPPRGSEGKTAD